MKEATYLLAGRNTKYDIGLHGETACGELQVMNIYINNPRLWTRIYKTNKSQIKNPDLIFPGQIFKIPPDSSSITKTKIETAPVADQAPSPEEDSSEEDETSSSEEDSSEEQQDSTEE